MSEMRVRLRVVTPLFMAGAEPRGNVAELRAASVRGVLRWWLRALLGGTGWADRPDARFADFATLWREEALVFGSVEPEPGGSSASAVTLFISDVQGRAMPLEPTPGRQPRRDYLLYGLHAQPRQNQPTRYYYPPGTQFTLHLRTRLGARQTQRAYTRACAALWLLTALGGLGARTRRGTGCLAVEQVEGAWPAGLPNLQPDPPCQTSADLRAWLVGGLQKIRTHNEIRNGHYVDGEPPAAPEPEVSPFTLLHPDYLQLYVWDTTWGEWGQALDDLGRAFGTFRRDKAGTDGKQIAAFIANGTVPADLTRPALGLPLPFFFSRLGKATVTGATTNDQKTAREYDRSASPISFHFTRLVDNRLALVLLVAYRALLPQAAQLRTDLQVDRSPDQWPGRDRPPAASVPIPKPAVYGDLIRRFRDYLESPDGLNRPRLWVGYRTKEGQGG